MDRVIQQLIADHKIEERSATDEEIAGFWSKAMVGYQDARITSISLEARFERAYTAARTAAVTVLRVHGYRVKGGEGHHYLAFYAANLLADQADLADAFVEADTMRSIRHDIQYGYEDDLGPEEMEAALDLVERVLDGAARHIRHRRPDLKNRIKIPRPRSRPQVSE